MSEVIVEISAEVMPTEDVEKVVRALTNVFPSIDVKVKEEGGKTTVQGSGEGTPLLQQFKNLLRIHRIRNSARAALLSSVQEKMVVFYLNKQVAYVGKVSFSEPFGESPLGPIEVRVRCDDPNALIDWLTKK